MNERIGNTIKMRKTTLTQRVDNAEKQWIISQGMHQNFKIVEGHLLSSHFDNGFSIGGGNTKELTTTRVVAVAPPSLIITILLEGKLKFGYDDLSFDLNAMNQALGIAVNLTKPANFRREVLQSNHIKKLHLTFTPTWIRNRLGNHCDITDFITGHKNHHFFQITPSIYQMASDIISFNAPNSFIQSIKLEALAHSLLTEVIEQLIISQKKQAISMKGDNAIKRQSNIPIQIVANKNIDRTVESILGYIESNLSQALTLEKVAESFSMSVSNLQRKFKQELSLTVNSYIRYRRLEIAKYHLEQGLISITEAAYEAGYHHPANFTHAFKKTFGHPPTIFAKR
jgi:AraC-like DNA-binding protein